MLTHISISNFTIVSSLEMEFSPGMTVITGETGAGKSIMLDALGLCLGDRADPKSVRQGCERAEIIAGFDTEAIPQATAWLEDRDLHTGDECLLRRVITAEGRSRAYINGSQLDDIKIGQQVTVLIDKNESDFLSFPGTISWISEKAEFTPKIVQTKEERVNLVYAIKILVKNDGTIKIGMPGEVVFNGTI